MTVKADGGGPRAKALQPSHVSPLDCRERRREKMRTPNPELQEAHWRGIALGAKTAAKIAKNLIKSGWTDMDKFEAEVWRRVRGRKK